MKQILTMVLLSVVTLLTYGRDFTYTYEGQTITYTVIDEEAGTCMTKAGYYDESAGYSFPGNDVSGSLILPAHPKDGNKKYTLTIIGEYAFYYCSGLTSVSIPESVTDIEQSAFNNCYGLTSITIPDSVTTIGAFAFSRSSCLTSVTIPDSVTTIGAFAFFHCSYLTSVTIPNSVTTIGGYAFCECSGLTSVTIGDSVTTINAATFSGCSGLTSVTLGNSVTTIGEYAFNKCSGLTSITIPDSVTKIGGEAFYSCSGLTSVTIGNSLTKIGEEAFYDCDGLTSVTIPNSVTTIGKDAFIYCDGLQEVNTGSIDNWLKIKFGNEHSNPTLYAKKLLVGGETIRRLTIPEGTERINAYAFYNCEHLVTVNLPASFRSVGDYAFSGCTGLQRFVFPTVEDYLSVNYDSPKSRLTQGNNSKIYIGSNPLDKPLDFTNLVIPSWMTRIPDYAFYGNNDILTVSMHNSIVEIGKGAFGNCSNLTSVEFPKSNFEIKESAFEESGLKSADFSGRNVKIGKNSFYDCKSLATVNFSSGTSEIGESAFAESGLTAVELPESISVIKPATFRNCHRLGNVIIPVSVDSIKMNAFAGCKAIQRLTLKGNVRYFGENAFGYTGGRYSEIYTSIQELDIPDYNAWCKAEFKVSRIDGYYYIYSNPIQAAKKLLCKGTKITTLDINIPDEDVSDYAFYKAPSLTQLNITAQSIGSYAFYKCKALKNIKFNKMPKSIGRDAFYDVNADVTDIPSANEWALVYFGNSDANPVSHSQQFTVKGAAPKHLVIDIDGHSVSPYAFCGTKQLESAKVTAWSIGGSAFANCDLQNLFVDVDSIGEKAFSPNNDMKRIYSATATPPAAGDDVFSKYEGIQLFVPAGAVSVYENAENCWWRFLDVFESDFSDLSSIFGRDYDDEPIFGAVNDVTSDAKTYRVVTSGGCVSLIGADDVPVSIFTISGIPVYTGRGCTEVPLAPGMYIIRAGSFSSKFALR